MLKIDRSFIQDVGGGSAQTEALTASILQLAAILELKPVAEGIEERDWFDRVVLDLAEPWATQPATADALAPGGVWCSYVPTVPQVQRTVEALDAHGFAHRRGSTDLAVPDSASLGRSARACSFDSGGGPTWPSCGATPSSV